MNITGTFSIRRAMGINGGSGQQEMITDLSGSIYKIKSVGGRSAAQWKWDDNGLLDHVGLDASRSWTGETSSAYGNASGGADAHSHQLSVGGSNSDSVEIN